MKSSPLRASAIGLLILFFSRVAISQPAVLYEVPIDVRIDRSDIVAEGRVVGQESFWDHEGKLIWTASRVELYRVFKGFPVGIDIEMITPGGRVGNVAQRAQPSLKLSIGDVGVFFGETVVPNNNGKDSEPNSEPNRYRPYASVQGFLRYDEFTGSASDVLKAHGDIDEEVYARLVGVLGDLRIVRPYSAPGPSSPTGKSLLVPVVSSFSPNPVTAGTGTLLTIVGSGFETLGGASSVLFPNADDGGASLIETPASEIVSWTDTRIQVRVPTAAGTGVFSVRTDSGVRASAGTPLTIDYSLVSVDQNGLKRTILESKSGGGYSLVMSTSVASRGVNFATSPAVDPFNRALLTWQQATGLNVRNDGGLTASNALAPNDEPDIVMFDNDGSALPAGVLGRVFTGFVSTNGTDWYVQGFDIQFHRDGRNGIDWNFGQQSTRACCSDFESVALHELGHAHQLGHIVAPGRVMHYFISNGSDLRVPDSVSDIGGGMDVIAFSVSKPNGMVPLTNVGDDDDPEDGLPYLSEMYPNPTSGSARFQLEVAQTEDVRVNVFDLLGRLVTTVYDGQVNPGARRTYVFDAESLPAGVYICVVRGASFKQERMLFLVR